MPVRQITCSRKVVKKTNNNTVDGAKGKMYEYANLVTLYNLVVSEICFIMQRSMLDGRQLGPVSSSSQSTPVIWAGTFIQITDQRNTYVASNSMMPCLLYCKDAGRKPLSFPGCTHAWLLSRRATVSGAQREDRC